MADDGRGRLNVGWWRWVGLGDMARTSRWKLEDIDKETFVGITRIVS